MSEIRKINIAEKFNQIDEFWSPRTIGEINDTAVKIAKIHGEFIWHLHENEDEMFLVIKGRLLLKFRDQDVWLDEGEMIVVPRGVEHMPVAEEEVQIMMVELNTTLNTGNVQNERTRESKPL